MECIVCEMNSESGFCGCSVPGITVDSSMEARLRVLERFGSTEQQKLVEEIYDRLHELGIS